MSAAGLGRRWGVVVALWAGAGCASGAAAGPGIPASRLDDSTLPVWEPVFDQELRATVGTFPPIEGRARTISGDVLLIRQQDRSYPLRISSIRRLEVRRYGRSRAVEGGLLGALAGGIVGRLTLVGIGGEHWESQGRLLAPGLGAIMGGLMGALVGRQFGGDYWEVVRIPASPVMAPVRRIVDLLTARDSRFAANRRNRPPGASRW